METIRLSQSCVLYRRSWKILCSSRLISLHYLFDELQSGFRKSHSTDTCLLHLNDHIMKEVDGGKCCSMVMLDLQKAFDTVDHEILLIKLRAMGLNNLAVKWVSSYPQGRKQIVDVNGTLSKPQILNCRVPQVSVLGLLVYLLYIFYCILYFYCI